MHDFILGAKIVTNIPMHAIVANDHLKFDACAINPISGGPIKNPKKPIVETVAIAIPELILRDFPAML